MRPAIAIGPSTLLAAALLLPGCGSSSTKTVSASSATASSAASAAGGHKATTPTSANGAPAPSTAAQTTRTATAPAFTKEAGGAGSGGGEALSQALAVVRAHGYSADDPSQYRPEQTLRVLVASRAGASEGRAQQAFFFVDGRYIGTDASAPSAGIRLVSQSDTEATLAYRLYRPGDPACCAHGGEATVRFQLDNGRLAALDPIPALGSRR
jgi:LppP/LprE lipoprotein